VPMDRKAAKAPPRKKVQQQELFPRSRTGARSRPVEVAAYDVRSESDQEIEHDVTFTARPSLWERLQTSSDSSGMDLAEWLLQAAREKLAREDEQEGPEPVDDGQQAFAFASAGSLRR